MKNKYLKTNTRYKANMNYRLAQEQFEYQLKKALEEGTEKNSLKNRHKRRGKKHGT